jgi:hypothetical protein
MYIHLSNIFLQALPVSKYGLDSRAKTIFYGLKRTIQIKGLRKIKFVTGWNP